MQDGCRWGRFAVVVLAVMLAGITARADSPPAESETTDPLTGKFEIKPRGLIVFNAIYGNRLLLPGPYALFAVAPALKGEQFVISPSNTTVGFSLEGVSFRDVRLGGALDVTLKSPTPLLTPNVLAPQFYDVHVAARSQHVDVRLGSFPDVLTVFVAPTTNGFPGGYIPGHLGAIRPQLRVGVQLPVGDAYDVLVAASLGRPLLTLRPPDQLFTIGAGVPDVQGRVAFALGARETIGALALRAVELGVSGHFGRRRIIGVNEEEIGDTKLNTWSMGADLRARLPTGTVIKLRAWRGSVLGDFMGGVMQSVSTQAVTPVRAQGFLAAVTQQLAHGWSTSAGFGRDDPDDGDLRTGERTINEAAFVNVFWDWSRKVGFAVEASRWRTGYKDQGATTAWRGEAMAFVRF